MDQGWHAAIAERRLAGEHPVHHDAEGVDVRSPVDRSPHDLLGRHVLDRPDEHAGVRELRLLIGRVRLGDAEIEDLHVVPATRALDEHHVRRLEVAMNDPRGVGDVERRAHLPGDVDADRNRQLAVTPQLRGERLALEQLHDEVHVALVAASEVEDLDDVLVLDARGVLRLAEKAASDLLVERDPVDASDQLHRDGAVHRQVGRSIHDPHAARPELGVELVSPA